MFSESLLTVEVFSWISLLKWLYFFIWKVYQTINIFESPFKCETGHFIQKLCPEQVNESGEKINLCSDKSLNKISRDTYLLSFNWAANKIALFCPLWLPLSISVRNGDRWERANTLVKHRKDINFLWGGSFVHCFHFFTYMNHTSNPQ